MPSVSSRCFSVLATATLVVAHSFVSNVNINRLSYQGFWPIEGMATDPLAVGWSTTAFDQGYVNQTGYETDEIICHRGASPAQGHAPVAPGDVVHIQWNGWPAGHKGPVMDYLASCGNALAPSCGTVNASALEFFKINEGGLLNSTPIAEGGTWASDQLIANNNSWAVQIPDYILPGFYVLRHEIIALHNASNPVGAQNYPQCINLEVTGDGDILPAGVPGRGLYDPESASLNLDIYASNGTVALGEYRIPGPAVALWGGPVSLSHPLPTGAGTAVTVSPAATAVV